MKTNTRLLSRMLMSLVIFTGFTANAQAFLLSQVGTLDTFLTSTALANSGAATEEAFIETSLGFNVDYTQLSGATSGASNWQAVTDGAAGDFAFFFGAGVTPNYFIIKTGNLNPGPPGNPGQNSDTFLFRNNANSEYAFVNLSQFLGVPAEPGNINIGKFSHVGITGERTDVPEPVTLALLGLGLLGVGFARRNKA